MKYPLPALYKIVFFKPLSSLMKFPLPALCTIVFFWKPLSSLMKFLLSALYKIVFLGAGKPLSRLQQAGVFAVGKPSTLESAIDRLVAFFFSSLRVVRGFYGLCRQKPGLFPVPKPECPFHTAKRPWHEWSWLLNSMHLEKQGPSKKVKPSEHYGGR